MDLILNGTFRSEYDEKDVEINGQPVKYMMAVLDTPDGPLPVVAWGEKKNALVKDAIKNHSAVKIAAVLQAKTYRNEEGKTVPYLQLKLYSFVGFPQPKVWNNPEPTGSFRCFSEEEKKEFLKPYTPEKVKPWPTNNGIEQYETWGNVF